ncbi:MAG: DNA-binding response regulator [Acidobacteria bacterium]|nr:MAG: DNA-binding response regulator [Acidobacteriota bacterium]
MKVYRLFIVEDHPITRQTLCEFLERVPDLTVVGTAASAEEALKQLGDSVKYDLLLVDVSLPAMSGIEFVGEVRKIAPDSRCVMLSGHDDITYVNRALAAGARGYLLKGNPDELVVGIREVMAGRTFFSADLAAKLDKNVESFSSTSR